MAAILEVSTQSIDYKPRRTTLADIRTKFYAGYVPNINIKLYRHNTQLLRIGGNHIQDLLHIFKELNTHGVYLNIQRRK
jgi:deoxyribodipyrimidine photolyase